MKINCLSEVKGLFSASFTIYSHISRHHQVIQYEWFSIIRGALTAEIDNF
jgi:hypothetical protein